MTEQPDTAAIRAEVSAFDHCRVEHAWQLLDALDAARAERDVHKDRYRAAQIVYVAEHERAEAAEAELARRDEAIQVRQNAAAYAEPKDLS